MEIIEITTTGWVAIIITVSMVILAGLMFIMGKQKVHFIWGIFCAVTAAWAGAFYGVTTSATPQEAQFWWKIAYMSIILIPSIFFHFVLEFTNSKYFNKLKYLVIALLYVIVLVFLFLNLSSNLIISNVKFLFNELYYAQPGIAHPYFTIFYFAIVFYACYLVYREYKIKYTDELFRQRAGYFFFAIIIGFLGASLNFLPVYGIEIHPITNLTVIFGSAVIAYAILRYRLFNIRVVTAQFLTLVIVSFAVVRLIVSNFVQEAIFNILLLFVTSLVGIYLIKSVKKEVEQREQIEKMAEDVKRAYVVEKQAKEELEKLDKFKDQFLMTAQHNLRTPLTSIMGYSDLMLNGTFGKQNKKTTEVIGKLQILARGMIKMVNDFLDMAQFQLGKGVVNLKPGVGLAPILEEIVDELKFKAESKEIYLNLDASAFESVPAISADREKLKAAVFNIIDNAVKYTEKGGITIKIKNQISPARNAFGIPARNDVAASGRANAGGKSKNNEGDGQILTSNSQLPNSIVIEVRDTGIGIPKEKLSTLFETQFERSEAAKKVASLGSGVGLYLAGQIIKAHNGRLWAESEGEGGEGEGSGSVFYVELPQ